MPGQGTNLFAPTGVTGESVALTDENLLGYIVKKQITLTSAQILALFTTPITLIPAQGTGTIIVINKFNAKLVYKTAAYVSANAIEVRYTNASGTKPVADIPASVLTTASTNYYLTTEAAVAPVENSPVVVCVPVANPTTGDSSIILDIEYSVRKIQ